jgi:DNA-binding transcriptional regulator PaaX
MTHDVLPSASTKAARVHLATSFVVNVEVSNAEKILVLLLSTHADEHGECRVRQEILAAEYGCSPRFVRRLLTQLRAKGFLAWKRCGWHNCYQLSATIVANPPFLPAKTSKKRMSKAKKHPI